jgi:hypothetical protein
MAVERNILADTMSDKAGEQYFMYRPRFFCAESTYNARFSMGRLRVLAALWTRKDGGKARTGPSLARPITAKLDARRAAGETLDRSHPAGSALPQGHQKPDPDFSSMRSRRAV